MDEFDKQIKAQNESMKRMLHILLSDIEEYEYTTIAEVKGGIHSYLDLINKELGEGNEKHRNR